MPTYRIIQGIRYEGRRYRPGETIDLPSAGLLAHALELVPTVAGECVPVAAPVRYGKVPADWPALHRVGLFVTGHCNIQCGMCSQKEYRLTHGDMPIETARLVLDQVRASSLRPILSITGGEPTLWPYLDEYLDEVHAAGCFLAVNMYSNIRDPQQIARLLTARHIGQVITNRANCNETGADALLAEFGKDRVNVSNCGHIPMPVRATWNCLPAVCHCPGVAVMGEHVYACPNMYSIGERIGRPVSLYANLRVPVTSDWIRHFREHEAEKYRSWYCQFCPSNVAYKTGVATDAKVLRYRSGV